MVLQSVSTIKCPLFVLPLPHWSIWGTLLASNGENSQMNDV